MRIENFREFNILKVIDELSNDEINEKFENLKTNLRVWFQKFNNVIEDILLFIVEKGVGAIKTIKKFFKMIFEKLSKIKESYPIISKIIITTLVLLVLVFVLCSAASNPDKKPSEFIINSAIGLLMDIKEGGTSGLDDLLLMKAQAYLLELKKTGNEINIDDESIKVAKSAIKVIQKNIQEYKLSTEKKPEDVEYLLNLAEKGARLVGYKLTEYVDEISGSHSSQNVSIYYK